MRAIRVVMLCAPVFVAAAGQAEADMIATRTALLADLGGGAINEDFESWSGMSIQDSGFTSLDSTTVVAGQGPDIVNDGLLFTNINSNQNSNWLVLDRRNVFNLTSGALLANGGTLVIDFESAVTHAGFDFFQYANLGISDTATVNVFASNDTDVLFTSGSLAAPNAPNEAFFGFEEITGIGRITIQSNTQGFSPLIDNLVYGGVPVPAAVPEPTSLVLLGATACVAGVGGVFRTRRERKQATA